MRLRWSCAPTDASAHWSRASSPSVACRLTMAMVSWSKSWSPATSSEAPSPRSSSVVFHHSRWVPVSQRGAVRHHRAAPRAAARSRRRPATRWSVPTVPVPARTGTPANHDGCSQLDPGRDVDDQVERRDSPRHLRERIVGGQRRAVADGVVRGGPDGPAGRCPGCRRRGPRRSPPAPRTRLASEAPSTATSAATPSGSTPAPTTPRGAAVTAMSPKRAARRSRYGVNN